MSVAAMASQLLLFPNRRLISHLDPHSGGFHIDKLTLSSF